MTPESVLKAFKRGIRSGHIIRYLESAAHPRALMRRGQGAAVVPENVRGQLEVWEANRSRTKSAHVVKISWAPNDPDSSNFERARKYAEDDGSLVWSRRESEGTSSLLIVEIEGAQRLREHLSERRVRARVA